MAAKVAGLDFESEARREADGPQQAEVVLGEAHLGVADGADQPGVEVGAAAHEVEHLAGHGVLEQAR